MYLDARFICFAIVTLLINNTIAGSPSGSTPVDFLLQSPWQFAAPAVDKGEESSQEPSPYTPRPRNYLVPKHRVSVGRWLLPCF